MSEDKKIISQHLFLFPFLITPHEAFSRSDIGKLLINDGWDNKDFDYQKNYSEFVYFHKYVRESAFNGKEHKDSFSDFYTKCACSTRDTLKLYWSKNDFYKLAIESVSLHIFETGIGILSIELLNHDYAELKDVLKINDLARRIYPPYLINDKPDTPPKGSAIPHKLEFSLDGTEITESFQEPFITKDGDLLVAAHILSLLGKSFQRQFKTQPVIDDRMYTMCWYGNDGFGEMMKRRNSRSYTYEASEEWYKFVFVDSGNDSCCQNLDMRADLIKKATYARWIEYGTLFGISRYSFVALTGKSAGFIRNHMQRQYFQMVVFLLAQRASAISFASRISIISREIDRLDDNGGVEKIARDVRKLHADFIGFVNRLWFEEVTPQEQGIELFEIAQSQMKLKKQIAELKKEMKELFEFIELQYSKVRIQNQDAQALEDSKLNKTVSKLTIIAGVCLPFTLLVGFWGMNFMFTTNQGLWWLIGSFILTFIIGFLLYLWAKKENS